MLSACVLAQTKNWENGVSINVKIDQMQFDLKSSDLGLIEIMDKDNYLLDFSNETVFVSEGIIKTFNKVNNQLIIDQLIEGDITIFDLLTGDFKDVLFENPDQRGNSIFVRAKLF